MASPSDDNVPESSEEEEVIDTGFDFLLFWDQYRQIILLVGGAVLLALVFFGIYEYNQSQRIAAAGAALAQAATEDDYRQVIAKYPGTVSAGDAALWPAAARRHASKVSPCRAGSFPPGAQPRPAGVILTPPPRPSSIRVHSERKSRKG